jgi:hypothetical protein
MGERAVRVAKALRQAFLMPVILLFLAATFFFWALLEVLSGGADEEQ